MDPTVLPTFLAAVLLIVIAPGPDHAYIAAVAVHRGPRAGVLSAAGMAMGMVVHLTAAALGLAVLLRATPWALDAIRLGGALYLGRLAWVTLSSAKKSGLTGGAPPPDRQILGRAILTNLSNPKVIIFFVAFLPQFVRAGHGPVGVQLFTLGALFLLVGLVIDSGVGLLAGRLGAALAPGARAATVLTTVAGLTFAGLALLLATEFLLGVVR